MKQKRGYATIVIIFVIGLVGLFLSLTLLSSGYVESMGGRAAASTDQAFFAAESALEDALSKIALDKTYVGSSTLTVPTLLGAATGSATVTGDSLQKTIAVTGTSGRFVRRLQAVVQNTSVVPGFNYAVHAGAHDFELEANAKIMGKTLSDGNVYSNGAIKGLSNDFSNGANECKSSASWIFGNASAVGSISDLANNNGNNSGVCVSKTASSSAFLNCTIKGAAKGPTAPTAKCPSGAYSTSAAPPVVPLPDMQLGIFKDTMTKNAMVFPSSCVADLTNSPTNCATGPNRDRLGSVIINGDLTIIVPAGKTLYISGPLWVKGKISVDTSGNNSTVDIDPSVTKSLVLLAEGRITTSSNLALGANGNIFLLFLSTFTPNPVPADLCDPANQHTKIAIDVSSNSNSALFYAQNGCIYVESNSTFHGSIIGEKVHVSNQSVVEYDPALQSAVFGFTNTSGWSTKSFNEY